MPSSQTKTASLALGDAVGDQIASVFTSEGYADADDRVWREAPRSGTPYPFAVFNVRETPSLLMGNKDDDPVTGTVTIRVHGKDDVTVNQIGGAIQESLVQKSNKPSVSGWRVVWHDLLFHEPLNDIREDAPNIYGRVLEIQYELDPN